MTKAKAKGKTKEAKRSLHQCAHAKVYGDEIRCEKGHKLTTRPPLRTLRLERGEPLEFKVCQDCPEYDEMGGPVAAKDRGWFKKEVKK